MQGECVEWKDLEQDNIPKQEQRAENQQSNERASEKAQTSFYLHFNEERIVIY